ncbi:MAG: tetratricopeptide repeat protein [Phormidium sp.]
MNSLVKTIGGGSLLVMSLVALPEPRLPRANAQSGSESEVSESESDANIQAQDWYETCVTATGQDAITACDTLIETDPDDERAWTNRGNALDEIGETEAALESHDRALELAPNYSLALANRCATLGSLGEHEAAVDSCLAAIEGDGRWGDSGEELAWDNMGVSLAYLERYEESLNAHRMALDLNPDYANAWNNLGATLFDLERYGEAIEAFEQALDLNPEDDLARSNLIVARQRDRQD